MPGAVGDEVHVVTLSDTSPQATVSRVTSTPAIVEVQLGVEVKHKQSDGSRIALSQAGTGTRRISHLIPLPSIRYKRESAPACRREGKCFRRPGSSPAKSGQKARSPDRGVLAAAKSVRARTTDNDFQPSA